MKRKAVLGGLQPVVGLGLLLLTVVALFIDISGKGLPAGFVGVPASVFAMLMLLSAAYAYSARARAAQAAVESEAARVQRCATEAASALNEPERMLGMVAFIDAQQKCLHISPSLARWLYRSAEELQGQPFADAFGPVNGPKLQAQLALALAGERQHLRCSALRADQTLQALQIELLPEKNAQGVVTGCQLFALDVSDEQHALESAQHSERRMRTIMDQIPVTVSYIDAEFRYRYINRAQEDWLGRRDCDVAGQPVRDVVGEGLGEHRAAPLLGHARRIGAAGTATCRQAGQPGVAFRAPRARFEQRRRSGGCLHRVLRHHPARHGRTGAAPPRT